MTASYPQVPPRLKTIELLVLAWTDHFFGADYLDPVSVANPHGEDIRLSFTTDRERLADADAVWFHGPSISDLPKAKNQPWVLMSMESDVNYPALGNPYTRLAFDLHMTYRLDADVPCIYPNWAQYGTFLTPPAARADESAGAPAVYIASNPVAHRDAYARELMHHIPVDSVGDCLRNKRVEHFAAGGWSEGAWVSIVSLLPRYKFYLAFENSCTLDYVTERVFHALICGVVPVYLGASNVREFMPADDAVIVASEFTSPADLASYLRHLDADDTAYQRHLRWKRDGYSDRFKRLVDLGSIDPRQRLAIKLAHGCEHGCRCGGRLRDRE